ncbi:hypothetical protein OTK59_24035 [Vibrio natriegens]|uniref:hypothetical protein n=1 Tax=Vibrio natriegens TaxID=691 RepID=UPI0022849559|nr:hypothetical protein [Vibrio natriegens]MCY9879613.1 hypothetical protein [Vibrio natriegens]
MNMTETKTLEDFINEYYETVELSSFTEKDVQEVFDTCLCRWDTTISGDFRLDPIKGSELDKINYSLQGCNLLYILKIGAIEAVTLHPHKQHQDVFVEYAEKLKQGYAPVSSAQRAFSKYNNGRHVGFIAFKPDCVQVQEQEKLKQEIERLLTWKCELENEELLAPEEAKSYALQKLADQEQDQEQALYLRAAQTAQKAKQRLLASGNTELTELLKSDWVTFENVKTISGESNNAKVENFLSDNGFIKKRKYISDNKQSVIWIREGKESEIDFKSITL